MSKVDWNSVKKEVPEWFRDAKFGLFFHWGPYSVPAYQDEWYSRRMYEKGNPCYRHHEETFGSVHDFGYKDFYPMMKGEKLDPGEDVYKRQAYGKGRGTDTAQLPSAQA